MLAKEIITDELAYPPKFGSPTALAIEAGDFVYVSGMIAWDTERRIVGVGDVRAQTKKVILNIEAALRAANLGLKDVIKVTFYLTDIRTKDAVWDVRKDLFKDCRPASTLVEVAHLVDPLALLEVDAVAYRGR